MNRNNTDQRNGPLSADEHDYIAQHAERLTIDEIATNLKRSPRTIRKTIQKLGFQPITDLNAPAAKEHDIRKSSHWKNLKEQFSDDEQEMFLQHWNRMHAQFNADVLYTEELQIIECIRIQILIDRIAKDQKKNRDSIGKAEKDLKNADEDDPTKVMIIERTLAAARMAEQEMTEKHNKLLNHLYKLLEGLKGTREARIKMIESGKETLAGWFKMLATDHVWRARVGVDMEKMRLAMNAEYERLSGYHKYYDGTLDQPILNSDTVTKVEEPNEGKENSTDSGDNGSDSELSGGTISRETMERAGFKTT